MSTKAERFENARKIIEDGPCTSITTITLQILCDYLQVTARTINRRIAAGELPPGIKRGREKVWRLIDIRKWLEKQLKKVQRFLAVLK
jgi:predicted DNA-binding transcriptional regulator AlpA